MVVDLTTVGRNGEVCARLAQAIATVVAVAEGAEAL